MLTGGPASRPCYRRAVRVCVSICACVCLRARVRVCVYGCAFVYLCLRLCVCVCACVRACACAGRRTGCPCRLRTSARPTEATAGRWPPLHDSRPTAQEPWADDAQAVGSSCGCTGCGGCTSCSRAEAQDSRADGGAAQDALRKLRWPWLRLRRRGYGSTAGRWPSLCGS